MVATDYIDADGSVVRSGIRFAEATLEALEQARAVVVSFRGLKGASSSYFNVYLRRIQEGCGLAELGRTIKIEFGSKVQQLVYTRSYEALIVNHEDSTNSGKGDSDENLVPINQPLSWWKRIVGLH